MRIIEIAPLSNGAHRNQTSSGKMPVPDGWAVIPDGLTTENFPFGEVVVEEINGIFTVTAWTPGTVPEPDPEPDPEAELTVWDELDAAYSAGYQEGVDSI